MTRKKSHGIIFSESEQEVHQIEEVKNMRLRLLSCVILLTAATLVFSGCQVTELFDHLVEPTTGTSSTASISTSATEENKIVDRNLADPEFTSFSGGSSTVTAGTPVKLDATATSPDGGTISYQWYVNNVNSNGGGTALEDETEAVYEPDTSEVSVKYYYVVAENDHDTSFTMVTSPVYEVNVIQEGTFTVDETGDKKYVAEDGTFPAGVMVRIGQDEYLFDDNGYVMTGWVDMGDDLVLYFDQDGKLLKNTVTPDGYYVDENGIRQL